MTKRDAWAGSFDELLTLQSPRKDCPLHFPTPPKIAAPWTCPGCHNEAEQMRRLGTRDSDDAGDEGIEAQHCSAKSRLCQGTDAVTEKQRRWIHHLMASSVTDGVTAPDVDKLTREEAQTWIDQHNHRWMQLEPPPKLSREEFMRWTAPSRR